MKNSKIEERVQKTIDEVRGILGERRSGDTRGAEDANIGTVVGPNDEVGQAVGIEKAGVIRGKPGLK